jgi:hypothetical protein
MPVYLLFLSLLTADSSASSFRAPVVEVEGVKHKLILSGFLEWGKFREAPESAEGFCAREGRGRYSGSVSSLSYSGPYALLGADGRVAKTFTDLEEHQARFWTAESIDCD